MSNERALIDRAVGGDAGAFEELAATHRPASYRIACGILGDEDTADDVAQDCLVRLSAALPGFRGDAELRTWIYRVTLNLCRDRLRRLRRRRGHVRLDEAAGEAAMVSEDTHEAELDSERARAALRAAIDRLPDAQREAITLRYLAGLEYGEIAQATATPAGTVASRVFRALKRLGEELELRHLEVLK